jgi:hypothetical protein
MLRLDHGSCCWMLDGRLPVPCAVPVDLLAPVLVRLG